jgi:hypothetical protein
MEQRGPVNDLYNPLNVHYNAVFNGTLCLSDMNLIQVLTMCQINGLHHEKLQYFA